MTLKNGALTGLRVLPFCPKGDDYEGFAVQETEVSGKDERHCLAVTANQYKLGSERGLPCHCIGVFGDPMTLESVATLQEHYLPDDGQAVAQRLTAYHVT